MLVAGLVLAAGLALGAVWAPGAGLGRGGGTVAGAVVVAVGAVFGVFAANEAEAQTSVPVATVETFQTAADLPTVAMEYIDEADALLKRDYSQAVVDAFTPRIRAAVLAVFQGQDIASAVSAIGQGFSTDSWRVAMHAANLVVVAGTHTRAGLGTVGSASDTEIAGYLTALRQKYIDSGGILSACPDTHPILNNDGTMCFAMLDECESGNPCGTADCTDPDLTQAGSTLTCGCDDEDEVLAMDSMSCLSECPGGEQERNGQCSDCPMERWSPAGGSCTTCTGGTISAGQDSCACPGNLVYHKSEFGGGRCQCPETGTTILNSAADMCVSECPGGSEVGTSEVRAFAGQEQCAACADDEWSAAGNACRTCVGGTVSGDQDGCECPAGMGEFEGECRTVRDCAGENRKDGVSAYSCGDCVSGYRSVGGACLLETDECAVGNGGCDRNAECYDADKTAGDGAGVVCTCVSPYADLDGEATTCELVCLNGGVLQSDNTCECDGEWTGQACGVDVNLCEIGNGGCDANADCVNRVGEAHLCECRLGFVGDGRRCERVADCANGGVLRSDNTCECASGWAGAHCEADADECAAGTADCGRGEVCLNLPAGRGYECRTETDECATGNGGCDANAVCSDSDLLSEGTVSCKCDAGFAGDGRSCSAIVTEVVCVNGVRNSDNSCRCEAGWTGTVCDEDVDECATGNGGCDDFAVCRNVVGNAAAECVCRAGWNGSGRECFPDAPVSGLYDASDFARGGWEVERSRDAAGREAWWGVIPLRTIDDSSRRSSGGTGDSDAPASVGLDAAADAGGDLTRRWSGGILRPAAGAAGRGGGGGGDLTRRWSGGIARPAAGAAGRVGGGGSGCVFAAHPGFDYGSSSPVISEGTHPRCGSSEVFGESGIPARPAGFDMGTDFIVQGSCPDGFSYNAERTGCVAGTGLVSPTGGSGGVDGRSAAGIYAAAVLGLGAWALWQEWSGTPYEGLSWSPSAEYDFRDGTGTGRYSLRADWRAADWGMWWTASEGRLGWGGEWQGEVFRAGVSSGTADSAVDLEADLGAEWGVRGWVLRPSWRLQAGADAGGVWRYGSGAEVTAEWERLGWRVRPSVVSGEFEDADLRVRVEREFGAGVY